MIIRVYPMSLEERATLMPGMDIEGLGFDSPEQTKPDESQLGQPLESTSTPK